MALGQGDRIFDSPCTWRYRERWLGSAGCGARSTKTAFWMHDGTLTGEDAIALGFGPHATFILAANRSHSA